LFDEPLSNLDAKLRGQMRVEIKALQRRLGVTSIYVTHDQLEAMTLADMLVVMNVGRVEQIGDPLDLYEAPATLFVAQFIGAPPMNLLEINPGAVPAGIGGLDALPIPPAGARLGVRPEHLMVAANGNAPADGIRLELAVDVVEAVGAETYVHGRLGGSGPLITCREAGRVTIAPGTSRAFAAARKDLHLFDATTGQRLPLAGA